MTMERTIFELACSLTLETIPIEIHFEKSNSWKNIGIIWSFAG